MSNKTWWIHRNLSLSKQTERRRRYLTGLRLAVVMLVIYALPIESAFASEGAELSAAVTKVEALIKGNLGKLAALVCVAVGAVMAAVKKDWAWLFGSVVLALGLSALVAMINASFTATI